MVQDVSTACFPPIQELNRKMQQLKASEPYTLVSLNDDCLLAIMQYMTVPELADLAQCSKRLRLLAGREYGQRYRNGYDFATKTNRTILRLFGHEIRVLNVSLYPTYLKEDSRVDTQLRILQLIVEYFPNVRKLDIKGLNGAVIGRHIWRSIIRNVAVLHFELDFTSTARVNTNLFQYCDNLTVLTYDSSKTCLDESLQTLRCRTLQYCCLMGNVNESNAFNAFFKSNPQIKQLKLYLSANCLDLSGIEHLQCLEKCSIAFTPTAYHKDESLQATFVSLYKGLGRIEALRAVYIGFDSFYHDALANLHGLNVLYLLPLHNNCDDGEWKERLRLLAAHMPQLIECFFHTHCINDDTMLEFITKCRHLKTVNVMTINRDFYSRLVRLCEAQNRTIHIMFRGDVHDLDEFVDLYQLHKNYVSIQECLLHKNFFEFPEAAVLRTTN